MEKAITFSLLLSVSIILGGCGQSLPAQNSSPQSLPAYEHWRASVKNEPKHLSESEVTQLRLERAKREKPDWLGDAKIPEVVREVDRDEQPKVLAKCLADQGIEARPTSSGVITGKLDDNGTSGSEQNTDPAALEMKRKRFQAASWECLVKYPVIESQVVDDSAISDQIYYEYYRDWWIPCVEQNFGGKYDRSQIPSLESYLNDHEWNLQGSESWKDISGDYFDPGTSKGMKLDQTCPILPPAAALSGEN
ncbi:hypothetical protein BK816_07815 [Boudabousia tangfeifanii]|uniref:Lipoprotein n=1 Tax=Boudabousia tangfeifanii TaxID=1912795 RepID=A0A1D9MLT8_9ACTO|nr:hypothetical protein [Boudabousia tangfeifanii]AOZ73208.1 hypothetical protein BK816_07815 [Boudabousia tangfeifanii]